jgi:hypothetical protein
LIRHGTVILSALPVIDISDIITVSAHQIISELKLTESVFLEKFKENSNNVVQQYITHHKLLDDESSNDKISNIKIGDVIKVIIDIETNNNVDESIPANSTFKLKKSTPVTDNQTIIDNTDDGLASQLVGSYIVGNITENPSDTTSEIIVETNKLSQSDITINGIAADISNNIKLNLTDLYISNINNDQIKDRLNADLLNAFLNAELLSALTYIIPSSILKNDSLQIYDTNKNTIIKYVTDSELTGIVYDFNDKFNNLSYKIDTLSSTVIDFKNITDAGLSDITNNMNIISGNVDIISGNVDNLYENQVLGIVKYEIPVIDNISGTIKAEDGSYNITWTHDLNTYIFTINKPGQVLATHITLPDKTIKYAYLDIISNEKNIKIMANAETHESLNLPWYIYAVNSINKN